MSWPRTGLVFEELKFRWSLSENLRPSVVISALCQVHEECPHPPVRRISLFFLVSDTGGCERVLHAAMSSLEMHLCKIRTLPVSSLFFFPGVPHPVSLGFGAEAPEIWAGACGLA